MHAFRPAESKQTSKQDKTTVYHRHWQVQARPRNSAAMIISRVSLYHEEK
jgi:hypothetical protein